MVERLGRFHKALTAGLNILIPFIDRVAYRHSLKEVPLDVPSQVCITRDNTIWFQQLHHGDYPACADNFALCHRPYGIG
ncbi:SPFH domain/band 7 family protein [Mycobacteroides abscessus subsp. massiliense]|nr:SPFH domain/band 7 family protein [Mycobacteroides abscessus subsp. massiliense]